VVADGGSTDGTREELLEWAQRESRLKVEVIERDWNCNRFALWDGAQKAAARNLCTGDFCWQQDADEVVHEKDYENIKNLVTNFPKHADLVSLPVVEYWGGPEKVRMDINPWKWRLSRNQDYITHGIPAQFRRQDENGELYATLGTDGADYIHNETHEYIPHLSFYTSEIHNTRMAALSGDENAMSAYQAWFNNLIDMLPGVHHYSWYDIGRKINMYKNFWQKFWLSLYDMKQDDTADNNMFFDKPWSEISEEEINTMSSRLATELGGWVFHSKVDFSNPTPHLTIDRNEPAIMKNED
jgi:glycosyltransferase involved in cell wall biosynthesis